MHKCNQSCYRKKRGTNQLVCRFKYPKSIATESSITYTNPTPPTYKSNIEYTSQRNHTKINSHNRFVLEQWRANVDVQ